MSNWIPIETTDELFRIIVKMIEKNILSKKEMEFFVQCFGNGSNKKELEEHLLQCGFSSISIFLDSPVKKMNGHNSSLQILGQAALIGMVRAQRDYLLNKK